MGYNRAGVPRANLYDLRYLFSCLWKGHGVL